MAFGPPILFVSEAPWEYDEELVAGHKEAHKRACRGVDREICKSFLRSTLPRNVGADDDLRSRL